LSDRECPDRGLRLTGIVICLKAVGCSSGRTSLRGFRGWGFEPCRPDCLIGCDVPTVFTAQSVKYRLLLPHTGESCWEDIGWLKFEIKTFLESAQN